MSNPFTSLKDYVEKPKRNTFDLSFQNNLTMEFGKLYPVFCKEVVPGDSFRIKPTFGLRFMPLVFPIQTRMQANLHFFYVRNRNLWKDWPDFIGRTKQNLVTPFLSPRVAKKVCKTRGLGDYFGIPTTLVGSSYGRVDRWSAPSILWQLPGSTPDQGWSWNYLCSSDDATASATAVGMSLETIIRHTKNWQSSTDQTDINVSRSRGALSGWFDMADVKETQIGNQTRRIIKIKMNRAYPVASGETLDTQRFCVYIVAKDPSIDGKERVVAATPILSLEGQYITSQHSRWDQMTAIDLVYDKANETFEFDLALASTQHRAYSAISDMTSGGYETFLKSLKEYTGSTEVRIIFCGVDNGTLAQQRISGRNVAYADGQAPWYGTQYYELNTIGSEIKDVSSVDDTLNPYATGDVKISALPFRAYESIYNAFYRNQFNDPFILNGVKEFNKFITTDEGGADDTDYDLLKRNWEMDFLTSAKQSPVDGDITPLVGVSSTGRFTFQNEDGSTYTVTPIVGEDGHTLTGIDSIEGEPENNTGIRRLMDLASVGISINDFRNVNALQRWLETNLRRGYRYKDQLMSHFGVDAKFDVLDMPEFIGGMSEPVMVNQISQSVDQTGNTSGMGDFSKVLGSYAGQASVLAQSKHDVSKYCDEHGFIIGILSISPVPNYSQLLPKMFLKNNVLDYYFPEFGHIGNQPIPYSEVCPLQSFAAGDPLTDVFGYQRAWYDYLAAVDEVHGDFRTSLEGFLINRVFGDRPELGKEFIEIDKDEMSDPFSVTDQVDKILGEVYFQVTAQRPIPKYGIPRLE